MKTCEIKKDFPILQNKNIAYLALFKQYYLYFTLTNHIYLMIIEILITYRKIEA